jgi:hypothetical protein
MIVLPSSSSGFINSNKAFPYLPRSIRDNNSLYPNNEFKVLPTQGGVAKWTETAPSGWGQYSPYYGVFLKYYLKSDESTESIPAGGGNIHCLKAAGIGSRLGVGITRNVTKNPISTTNIANDWSMYTIVANSVSITTQTYVDFGCFYKVSSKDSLRSLNFGAIAIHFTKSATFNSYLNYSIIHGGGVNLLGNNSTYTYFNTYDADKTYEAYNQWLGRAVIKFKKLDEINQSSIFDQWQFLTYRVAIPTFVNTPQDDGTTGKADSCTLRLCFCENNSYLDDGSGLNTGSIQFLYPFLSLS